MAEQKKATAQQLPATLGKTFAERKKARLAREGKAIQSAENKAVSAAQAKSKE